MLYKLIQKQETYEKIIQGDSVRNAPYRKRKANKKKTLLSVSFIRNAFFRK